MGVPGSVQIDRRIGAIPGKERFRPLLKEMLKVCPEERVQGIDLLFK